MPIFSIVGLQIRLSGYQVNGLRFQPVAGQKTCGLNFELTSPEGGSTERGAGRTERYKPPPYFRAPFWALVQGRQTTVAICDTGPNDKVEDKTTLNRGTGERAKICAG